MTANPRPEELPTRLEELVRYRQEQLRGDEKGEAQVFLDRLFRALGHGGVFEAGATLEQRVRRRDNGGTAFADLVWRPRVLIEMKRAGQDLTRHYRQAFEYWIDLVPDRPQYMVLCNFDEFWVYDLNVQLDVPVHRLQLADLARGWEALAFLLPTPVRPTFGNDLVAVTRASAATMSALFNRLIDRGVEREDAQRFVLQAVVAMFSEDIGLLPSHLFSQAAEDCSNGASAFDLIFGLFTQMNTPGRTPAGRYGGTPYFNGGIFRRVAPFELERDETEILRAACQPDWSQVSPAIFGTLFEQSLGRDERHAFGAHFTSEADIQQIVLPSIVRPWRARIDEAVTLEELGRVEHDLLQFKVLDPTCGCGNFLYVAYREIRRLERQLGERIISRRRRPGADAELGMSFVSTTQFFGIDIRPFAVEMAKVTLMLARKLAADELGDERRVLPLDDLDGNFLAADALVVDWPAFNVCIGNPPYLGRRKIVEERGADYASWLGERYPDVGGVSDYVSYFFRRTHDLLPEGGRAGLVGTNAIRRGDTRSASLDYIVDNGGTIYDAHASQPWSGEAVVQVSIVNWAKGLDVSPKTLWLANGSLRLEVDQITGSLSPEVDLREARELGVNSDPKVAFQGQTPGNSAFVLSRYQASEMIRRDPRSQEVVFPYLVGREISGDAQPGRYIVDIPSGDLVTANRWSGALRHLRETVLPVRRAAAEEEERRNAEILARNPLARVNRHHTRFLDTWWQLSYRRGDLIQSIESLPRYIALSRVAVEHRPSIYVFMAPSVRPGDAVQVFALADDYSFGVLTSRWHRRWFEERCSTMRIDLRYTAGRVFDFFPWPQAPTESQIQRIVDAVEAILVCREERLREGITLGAQYRSMEEPGRNQLRELHQDLDLVVGETYGFDPDEDELAQLLALNESIAREESTGRTRPRGPGGAGLAGATRTLLRTDPPPLT